MADREIDGCVEVINAEHCALSQQIHGLGSAFSKDVPDDAEILILLRALSSFAVGHFKHEEDLMEAIDYTDIDLHKKDHAYLLQMLSEFIASFVDGRISISSQTGASFLSWLNFHITKYDSIFDALASEARPGQRLPTPLSQ